MEKYQYSQLLIYPGQIWSIFFVMAGMWELYLQVNIGVRDQNLLYKDLLVNLRFVYADVSVCVCVCEGGGCLGFEILTIRLEIKCISWH